MRLNRLVAQSSALSRRAADQAIRDGRVRVGDRPAQLGQVVKDDDQVTLDGRTLQRAQPQTVLFYKPVGVICSRRRQGTSPTIYDLLPGELQGLNPVGRLDKDTSGLLLLTSDGGLQQRLSHPSFGKTKRYQAQLDRPLSAEALASLRQGLMLADGPSRPHIIASRGRQVTLELEEGRNRQVRRTFQALGYRVMALHRPVFAGLQLGELAPGAWRALQPQELP